MRYRLLLTGILLLLGAGCAPDITETDFYSRHPEEPGPDTEALVLGTHTDGALTLRVLSPEPLHAGYNLIRVEASRGSEPVTAGRIVLTPSWVTATHTLKAPLVAPPVTEVDADGHFETPVFFIESLEGAGAWEIEVAYEAGGRTGAVSLPVDVLPALWVQHVASSDGYYVSWAAPVRPVTGEASLDLALHRLTDTGFVPVTDAALDLYPYMDMGGGEGHSTPYQAPAHLAEGLYRGTINFIMSGGWDLTVYVRRPGAPVDTVAFEGFIVN